MLNRLLYTLSALVMSLGLCNAQEVIDTLKVEGKAGYNEEIIRELTTPKGKNLNEDAIPGLQPLDASDLKNSLDYDLPSTLKAPQLHYEIYPRGSRLPAWANGYMYGYNRVQNNLMFGYVANAGFGVQQRLGHYWTLTAGMDLSKYSVYYNTATVNGSLKWHPNEHFAVTVFGSYMPGSFMSQMKLPQQFEWGGYITLQTDTDVPFGIDLGARSYYDPFSGHIVTPIVMPYVKMGESKIGIDFGPMIRNATSGGRNNFGPGESVIPKPMKAIPQVGPRR
ncbi:MAG: hypothetical protein Q4B58_07800 [Bacteroidales bacterium]|nr:hypothetical protein [Bacteroidales bacterium]